MRCGVNVYRGQLVRYADAPSAVLAYDLAEADALRSAEKSVPRFVAGLQCPQNCAHAGYDSSTLSISIKRLWSAQSTVNPDHHRVVLQADYTFKVACSTNAALPLMESDPEPVEVAPSRAADDPVAAVTAPLPPEPPPPEPPEPPESPAPPASVSTAPCEITFSLTDNSTRRGLGLVDWNLDVVVNARNGDPGHGWGASGCRITSLNFSAWSAPGSWAIANKFGGTRSLMDDANGGYGLAIAPGPGSATVSGTLSSGTNGIAVLPGSAIQLLGDATDSNGDTAGFEFVLRLPN